MVNNVSVLNSKSIKDKELQLNIKISEGILVNIDEPFFKNALHNLLSNAIKFSHPGGDITIEALEDEVNVTLKLTDYGKGMLEEVKNTILEKSNTKSTRGTKGEKGTGIGLSIVKRIIDLHKASISIESELNRGTQITIQLPK